MLIASISGRFTGNSIRGAEVTPGRHPPCTPVKQVRALLLAAAAFLGACVRYAPAPLDLSAAPAAYQARSLSDPAIRAALDSLGIHPADDRPAAPGVHGAVGWDDWSLAHVAWLMRPERTRLAAEVRAAEAGVVAAGGRPAPGVQGGVEGTFSGKDGTSPLAMGLSGLFRLELGGKRDARIARARAVVLAAQARAEVANWSFRLEVRRRLREVRTAWQLTVRTDRLRASADHLVALSERRFDDGIVGRAELSRIRAERDAIQAELLDARRQQTDAEARLYQDSGLPVLALSLRVGADADCERAIVLAPDSLDRLALTHRPELALVLAEYQESEADVRIAVAGSWPDFELGPGLLYDHGAGKWTIGFGLPAIPANYRGPLAESVARREVQAARVAEVQTAVLAEVDGAVRRCQAARAAGQEIQPLMQGAWERLQSARDARERGETDEAPVTQAELEVSRWERVATEAHARRASAELELDAAIGIWNRVALTESEEPRE